MSDACQSSGSDYSEDSQKPLYDVVIVGGGPAGLSAALVLGRCLRKVLICDEGQPRNSRAEALKGFLPAITLLLMNFCAPLAKSLSDMIQSNSWPAK
jgi:choline dehydrogenase-like flavoprotein